MSVRRSRRRVAEAIQRRTDTGTVRVVKGTVTDVDSTVGASTDGAPVAHVTTEDGSTIAAPYYGTAPSVGDVVDVLLVDNSPRILGKPVGLPTV